MNNSVVSPSERGGLVGFILITEPQLKLGVTLSMP